MANQKLYLTELVETPTQLGNSMSTTYQYQGGKLRIYWKGRLLHEQPAKIGDAFHVNVDGGYLQIHPLKLPKAPSQLVLWLVGVPRPLRTTNREAYNAIANRERKANGWWAHEPWSYPYGNGWSIAMCNRPDCGGIHWVCAYINPAKFNKGMAIEILKTADIQSDCPLQFAETVLRERLGFSDANIAAVHDHLAKYLP